MTEKKEQLVEGVTTDQERAFYNTKNTHFLNCKIDGPADGESAFKECRNITVENTLNNLRYAYWHDENLNIINCTLAEPARASIWYCNNVNMTGTKIQSVKAFRNCNNIIIKDCDIVSEDFGWKCDGIKMSNCTLDEGVRSFLDVNNVIIESCNLKGKYMFQYSSNLTFLDTTLESKDFLWHAKNVYCKNCTIKSEYLAWYSENVVLENCLVDSIQPLCYCKRLKLINCRMENCNLGFEYSDVEADIRGHIQSAKNILNGKVVVDSYDEYVTEDPVYKCNGVIEARKKGHEEKGDKKEEEKKTEEKK